MRRSTIDHRETYEPGEVIVREGDESREMFVIQKGQVIVSRNVDGRDVEFARLDRGDFFGEMSLLESMPRNATVRAAVETKLLVFKPGSLLFTIRRDPTFAFEMLQRMSKRIRDTDEWLVKLMASGKISSEVSDEVAQLRAAPGIGEGQK